MDDAGQYPAVHSSLFGWCVRPDTAHCPIRVEYDREKSARQSCHIQIDGESGGWAYGMGRLGRTLAPMQKLHLPMGGRRFRPSLEDFLEFLIQGRMVPQKRKAWLGAIETGRSKWEHRQTGATVRRDPTTAAQALAAVAPEQAAAALTERGWRVAPPPT